MGDSTKIIQTSLGDVIVRKMPLSDYAELLSALDEMPNKFNDIFGGISDDKLKSMKEVEFVAMIPVVLSKSWNDIIALVAVPTDKDAEFLGKLDLADAVDIVEAILDLNDVQRIVNAVKKMLALRAKIARPQKQKQT